MTLITGTKAQTIPDEQGAHNVHGEGGGSRVGMEKSNLS